MDTIRLQAPLVARRSWRELFSTAGRIFAGLVLVGPVSAGLISIDKGQENKANNILVEAFSLAILFQMLLHTGNE